MPPYVRGARAGSAGSQCLLVGFGCRQRGQNMSASPNRFEKRDAMSSSPDIEIFPSCPMCGVTAARELFTHPECGRIVRCDSCGLTYARSRQLPSWPTIRRANPEPYPDFMLERSTDQTSDFLAILGVVQRFQPPGRVIDIG